MKTISFDKYKSKLRDLVYTAQNNCKVCISDIEIHHYKEASNDIKEVKEDIICLSTMMPQTCNFSSNVFKLLSQVDNLATLQSLSDLRKVKNILNKMSEIDLFIRKMK